MANIFISQQPLYDHIKLLRLYQTSLHKNKLKSVYSSSSLINFSRSIVSRRVLRWGKLNWVNKIGC